jgi:Xaa-Pro aminopeptidase
MPSGDQRLGFEDHQLTVHAHSELREKLPERIELVAAGTPVGALRAVKDAGEIANIRAATELADAALREIMEQGIVGRTEIAVATALEDAIRARGASGLSFSSIVASGPHGALPHATPRDVTIGAGELVVIDWGARIDGYCSDCTRTYATGEGVSAEAREVYATVLAAQEAGVAAVQAGPTGRDVDAIARAVIEQAGFGEHFGHGLGHGVGLDVHEAPRLSRIESEQPLLAGNVVTVEPGIYLPGRLGVRIEDLLVVREGAQETLNGLDKALTVIS